MTVRGRSATTCRLPRKCPQGIQDQIDPSPHLHHPPTVSPFPDYGLDANALFFHVFDWPEGALEINGLDAQVTSAYILTDPDHTPLPVQRTPKGIRVDVPACPPDLVATVIVFEVVEATAK